MPYFSNYDALPYIDRSMLLPIAYYRKNRRNTLLQTAKGCENTCVFCQRKGWQDHYVPHSDEYVLGELRVLQEQDYKNVWVTDENFTFDLGRAKRLFSTMYERSLMAGMRFFISSWANIDYAFLDLAARCNVRIISFGIESACREILDFYKKNIRPERVPDLIRYADSIGIFTVGNFILGAPMETDESIEATFSLQGGRLLSTYPLSPFKNVEERPPVFAGGRSIQPRKTVTFLSPEFPCSNAPVPLPAPRR